MYKILLIILLLIKVTLIAKDITPVTTIKTSGIVSDFVEDKGYLYVATDVGIVDIIDLITQKIVRQIKFKPILGTNGELIHVHIYAIDRFKNKTLFVTSGKNAYRNVWISNGNVLKKIIDESKHIMPKKAFFTTEGNIIFGTFGSDTILYNQDEDSKLYDIHISQSTMGGMVLSKDKKHMVISDESGTVRVIDINSSKIEKTLSKEHVDNIYNVAYSKNTIITAGEDRRVGVYFPDGSSYHLNSNFLVYAVGLSPNAKIGVYSSGFNHNLQLFDIATKRKGDRLVGHYAIPNKILFINETSIISAGDEDKIFFWNLKK